MSCVNDRHLIESKRMTLQSELDAGKTQEERNRLGQFATPTPLAMDILQYAELFFDPNDNIRFFDPAFGTGSFYSALLDVFGPKRIAQATAFEIDPYYGDKARQLWEGFPLNLSIEDFTRSTAPQGSSLKADLVICNPPYVRHHHLASEEKLRLKLQIETELGIRFSGLAGLYSYFLCLSLPWMVENGFAGWLIPSEFMDVNYGKALKIFLLNRVTLLRIHRFDPGDVQFADAMVSSAVVWFRNSKPPSRHEVEFTYGGSLLKPCRSSSISVSKLRKARKWTRFPKDIQVAPAPDSRVTLGDFFTIKRGIATGANQFFILCPDDIEKRQIPREFLTPVLPSPRFLKETEIQADQQGDPVIERQGFLFSCELPEDKLKNEYPTVWEYLQEGEATGLNERYLCRHRKPWYVQENRPAASLLCTYMGRMSNGNGVPFRFILNHSQATATNVYLLLYPKPLIARRLHQEPTLLRRIWQSLQQIPMESLVAEGRVYGGGLYKLEPNELARTPADGMLNIFPDYSGYKVKQLTLF